MSEIIIVPGENKRVNAIVGDRTIKTDQSRLAGGDSSAPEPFTLFLVSLGTCAGSYVFQFCQARNISTEGVKIKEKIISRKDGKGIEKIQFEIELPPEFPEKYEKAVVRAANLCTVKKYLENTPEITVGIKKN
ncbi:MAG: OsmC family protein [Myxococcota bacterium]